MSSRMKTVFLFIVEGISDKSLLEPLINKIVDTKKIHIEYTNGDITALTKPADMRKKLGEVIKRFQTNNRSLAHYIEKAIFITDTDGCFIDDSFIYYSTKDTNFRYEDNGIYTDRPQDVRLRNNYKANNANMLSSTAKIMRLPLETYYFSCNLDHVFYNERNLENKLKYEYADAFTDEYDGRESEFITFFSKNSLTLSNDYKISWDNIKQDLNSLLRYSNFHLFFINNQDFLSEECKKHLNNAYLNGNINHE